MQLPACRAAFPGTILAILLTQIGLSAVAAGARLDGPLRTVSPHRELQETGASKQELFDKLLAISEEVHAATKDQSWLPASFLMRSAFSVCPSCRAHLDGRGKWFDYMFSVDQWPDRAYLRDKIIPELAKRGPTDVLWVGVQAFTLRYEYLFAEQNMRFATIEPDPEQAIWGSLHRHLVDGVQGLTRHARPNSFDVVLLNGVIGWGLNEKEEISMAVRAIARVLKPNGVVVVGYNNGTSCCSQFESLFQPAKLGSLPHEAHMDESERHHIYKFYTLTEHMQHMKGEFIALEWQKAV